MNTQTAMMDTDDAIFQGFELNKKNILGAGAGLGWRARFQCLAADAAGRLDDADKIAAARAGLQGAAIGALLLDVGNQAARIQSQRLVNLRGVSPSATSIADAAADATAGAVRVGLRLERFGVDLAKEYPARMRGGRLVRRNARGICLLFANRAAFRSLCSWASVGISGDEVAMFNGAAFVSELTSELAQKLATERDGGGDLWQVESVAARWRVARWVYRVGVQSFAASLPADMRARARADAIAAAVNRSRVVADCIFGLPLPDAIAAAGFSSGAAWVNSCRAANFFLKLAQAATGAGDVATARAKMRAAALQAAAAIRSQRAASATGDAMPGFWPGGVRNITRQVTRGVIAANNGKSQWAQATEQRGTAVALAVHWRNVAQRRAADNAAAFKRVLQGIRSDKFSDLSKVFGVGKRSSKLHVTFIRSRPSGKVSTRRDTATVSLKVGRTARTMPCALLA